MNSILADLIAALAGAVFVGGIIWLTAAKLNDEAVPTAAIIITIYAAIVGIAAGAIAANLRAYHRRERR